MSAPEQVGHPGESPVLEGEVSRPRRAATTAGDPADGDAARTARSAGKPAGKTDDVVVKRPLPPAQVLIAAGLVLVALELVLWQVGGVAVALLAHVVLAAAAAVIALIMWLARRARDRRAGRDTTGRGAARPSRSGAAGPGNPGGRGTPGGGLLSRLRGRGAAGAGRTGTADGGAAGGGRSAGGGAGAGRTPSRLGGLLSRLRPGGGAAGGRTGGAAGGGTGGGSARPGGAGTTGGGSGRGGSRLGGLLSRMRRPGSGSAAGSGRGAAGGTGSAGTGSAAGGRSGLLGRLGAAVRRPGGAARGASTARPAAAGTGRASGSGAGGSGGGRRGPLSRAAGLFRRGGGTAAAGGRSGAGRPAGRSGSGAGSGTAAGSGRRGAGLGRAFMDGLRGGAKSADERLKTRGGKPAADGTGKDKTGPAADTDGQAGAGQRRGWRERLFGRKDDDQAQQNTPAKTTTGGPAGPAAPEHEPRHKRQPGQPDPGLVKEEIAKAAKTVRKPAAGHQPRHGNTAHQPQHTSGGTEMDASRIKTAAEELQAALASYDPGAMRQLLRDVPAIGEALAGVGAGVRAVATRAESDFPVAKEVVDALYTMANDVTAAGDTADVSDVMRGQHEADIERHDAPRGGSKASEARWDVTTDEG